MIQKYLCINMLLLILCLNISCSSPEVEVPDIVLSMELYVENEGAEVWYGFATFATDREYNISLEQYEGKMRYNNILRSQYEDFVLARMQALEISSDVKEGEICVELRKYNMDSTRMYSEKICYDNLNQTNGVVELFEYLDELHETGRIVGGDASKDDLSKPSLYIMK